MLSSLARASYACVLAMIIAAGAAAQSPEPQNPRGELTLAQAIEAALRGNPDLAASNYELTAAQARIVQAGLRPNTELAVELENFAGSGGARSTDALETTLSLSQAIELGGKRRLRVSAAEMDLAAVGVEQRARELDVLADVARRFIDVVAAQEGVRVSADAATLARTTLDAISARVEAGRSPEAERSRARIALTRAEIERRQAESRLVGARVGLAALWGSAEPQFATVRSSAGACFRRVAGQSRANTGPASVRLGCASQGGSVTSGACASTAQHRLQFGCQAIRRDGRYRTRRRLLHVAADVRSQPRRDSRGARATRSIAGHA